MLIKHVDTPASCFGHVRDAVLNDKMPISSKAGCSRSCPRLDLNVDALFSNVSFTYIYICIV